MWVVHNYIVRLMCTVYTICHSDATILRMLFARLTSRPYYYGPYRSYYCTERKINNYRT